jgi:hypothetical protein
MMKAAEPRDWFDTAHCLRRSVERSVLVKRNVGTCPVVVGAIYCQQMARVTFAEHHDVDGERGVMGRSQCPWFGAGALQPHHTRRHGLG